MNRELNWDMFQAFETRYEAPLDTNRAIKERILKPDSVKQYRTKRSTVVLFAACLVLAFAVTGWAAVKNDWFGWTRSNENTWSRGMDSKISGSNEQWLQMIDKGLAVDLISEGVEPVTIKGVTITPNIAVTDGVVGYVSFVITGYELGEKGIPTFQGKGDIGFAEPVGQMVFDGFFRDGEEDIFSSAGYEGADGEIEYIQKCMKGYGTYSEPIFELTLDADFLNLSTKHPDEFAKDEEGFYSDVVEGVWSFDIKMPDGSGADELSREITLNQKLGDSGISITSLMITPLSISIFYESEDDSKSLHPEIVAVNGDFECIGENDYIWQDGGNQSRMYVKKLIDSESVETITFTVADKFGIGDGITYELEISGGLNK